MRICTKYILFTLGSALKAITHVELCHFWNNLGRNCFLQSYFSEIDSLGQDVLISTQFTSNISFDSAAIEWKFMFLLNNGVLTK